MSWVAYCFSDFLLTRGLNIMFQPTSSDPEEASSPAPSSAVECLTKQKPSPVKIETTSWKPKAKASSSSSSDDSEESSSSSDEDTGRNKWHAQVTSISASSVFYLSFLSM